MPLIALEQAGCAWTLGRWRVGIGIRGHRARPRHPRAEASLHIGGGAKKVIISAPPKARAPRGGP